MPSSFGGVPTQRKCTSPNAATSSYDVVKRSRPDVYERIGGGAGVEEEAAFDFLAGGGVALVALFDEDGADAGLEESGLVCGDGDGFGGEKGGRQQQV